MTINQAFTILATASDAHTARIITEHFGEMSRFAVWRVARKLRCGMPVAKIIHKKWFYGLPFYTNRHTLDPRPDTETIVDSVLHDYRGAGRLRVLDMGTGTGCIIISILKNMPGATGVGIDVSRRALRVVRKNARNLGVVERVTVARGTFAHPDVCAEQFDVIVSNPPYIAYGDKRVNTEATFDPQIALYAENNGLFAYEQIADSARSLLKPSGCVYVEIGAGMSRVVRGIFARAGWKFVRADKDLGGKIRVLVFSR